MQRPTATITVQRQTATTDARLQSLLSPVLSRRVRAFTPGGQAGYQQQFETVRYFDVGSQGRLITYAGLVPRAEECLRQAGYDVTIVDRTLWPVYAGADKAMLQRSELSINDKRLLAAIAGHPRGQVLLDKPAELPRALALVCCFFSEARVLVVAKSREAAKHVQDGLRKYVDGAVNLGSEVDWAEQSRLSVVTADTFATCNGDDWDVVLFVGQETVLGKQAFDRAVRMQDQLRFCFRVQQGREPGQHESLRLSAACGSVIHDARHCEHRPPTVRVIVAWLPVINLNVVAGRDDDRHNLHTCPALQRKRSAIWRNDIRNNTIAGIAQAIVDSDTNTLWQHGLLLNADANYLQDAYGQPRVAILVESAEHGRELLKRLEGWELIADTRSGVADTGSRAAETGSGVTDTRCGAANTRSRAKGVKPSALSRVIITETAASKLDLAIDVLIRASGGDAALASEIANCGRTSGSKAPTQLLVDFADDWDAQAEAATRLRLRDYQRLGWIVDDAPRSLTSTETGEGSDGHAIKDLPTHATHLSDHHKKQTFTASKTQARKPKARTHRNHQSS